MTKGNAYVMLRFLRNIPKYFKGLIGKKHNLSSTHSKLKMLSISGLK